MSDRGRKLARQPRQLGSTSVASLCHPSAHCTLCFVTVVDSLSSQDVQCLCGLDQLLHDGLQFALTIGRTGHLCSMSARLRLENVVHSTKQQSAAPSSRQANRQAAQSAHRDPVSSSSAPSALLDCQLSLLCLTLLASELVLQLFFPHARILSLFDLCHTACTLLTNQQCSSRTQRSATPTRQRTKVGHHLRRGQRRGRRRRSRFR